MRAFYSLRDTNTHPWIGCVFDPAKYKILVYALFKAAQAGPELEVGGNIPIGICRTVIRIPITGTCIKCIVPIAPCKQEKGKDPTASRTNHRHIYAHNPLS